MIDITFTAKSEFYKQNYDQDWERLIYIPLRLKTQGKCITPDEWFWIIRIGKEVIASRVTGKHFSDFLYVDCGISKVWVRDD